MLNNPILQVVTGLAFLYLIYSLLATILKEFIASLFSYRSRMLEIGIQQMLDGHTISYYWWDRIINVFIWLFGWTRALMTRQRPKAPGHVSAFLAVRPAITGIKRPARWKLNAKGEMFSARVIDHALYKRSGEVTWMKSKKPAYLPAETFSDILLDIFGSDATRAVGTRLILMKDVSDYIKNHLAKNGELQKILNIYVEQANGDVVKFRALLSNWYDDTMDRVTGWYKRQANFILLLLGLGLALGFNVDTIAIIKKLSHDPTTRNALVQNAAHYIDSRANKDIEATKATGDTTTVKKYVAQIQSLYDSTIDTANTLLGLGWDKRDPLSAQSSAFSHYWQKKLPTAVFNPIYGSLTHPRYILGFILTALAISLGAPFWFDLLNKLVSLRAAGTKPEKAPPAGAVSTLTQKPDPSAKG